MKNSLEGELISIAHRILKLKNKSETIQLQQETLNLYEKLSVLRFVEENYDDAFVEIPTDIEDKLELLERIETEEATTEEKSEKVTESIEEEITNEVIEENDVEISTDIEDELKHSESKETTAKTTDSIQEETPTEENTSIRFDDFEANLSNAKPQKESSIFDEVIPEENHFTPTDQTPKNISINDAVKKNFNIGLNDRVAFEFHLFGGETQDFNRVISQLNTFETFNQAKDFIENMVKPDYNNWFMKEEYEARFMEIIENRFA